MWFYLYCVFTYLSYTQFHPHSLLAFHPWKQCVLSSQFNTNPKFNLNSLLKQLESLRLTADYLRRRQWYPTTKSHGRRSLMGCSPWGRQESDTTERLHFHFSLSCTGEGNGNPLQCSCLRISGMAEPGGLPSMWSHRVGHD